MQGSHIERNVPSEDKAIFAIFSPGTGLGILFRSVDYIAIEEEALIMLLGVRYVFRKSNGIWGAFRKHVDGMRVGAYDRMISIIAVPVWHNQPVRDSTNNAFLALEHQAVTRPVLDVDMCGADTQEVLNEGFLLLVIGLNARERGERGHRTSQDYKTNQHDYTSLEGRHELCRYTRWQPEIIEACTLPQGPKYSRNGYQQANQVACTPRLQSG